MKQTANMLEVRQLIQEGWRVLSYGTWGIGGFVVLLGRV